MWKKEDTFRRTFVFGSLHLSRLIAFGQNRSHLHHMPTQQYMMNITSNEKILPGAYVRTRYNISLDLCWSFFEIGPSGNLTFYALRTNSSTRYIRRMYVYIRAVTHIHIFLPTTHTHIPLLHHPPLSHTTALLLPRVPSSSSVGSTLARPRHAPPLLLVTSSSSI